MPTQVTDKENLSNLGHNPDAGYLNMLSEIDFQPIFIMGDHRSGTTLLYKLLAETDCFNFVNTYHIIKYNELLCNRLNNTEQQAQQEVNELFQALGLKNRLIDKVAVTAGLPEEYGFILGNAGKPTHICLENLQDFRELCQKIKFISAPQKSLLLKNPWDFANFRYIKSVFPAAKFIFIHRHPIHIINSQLKASLSMLSTKNAYIAAISEEYAKLYAHPWRLWYRKLRNSLFFQRSLSTATRDVAQALDYFIENINSLPKTDYISVRYEELSQKPEQVVLSILNFLQLQPESPLSYDTLIESRPLSLLPEVARKYDQLHQELQPYFDYLDYEE
ncbi:MAG: sulfotransferase [Symploca sp. SIO2C1]|nr:sulfotransferase [Symploca sp. SIO2C1]